MRSLLIVGAGAAGLAAAYRLRHLADAHALQIVVAEKSRGVSGRAATRWREVESPGGTVRWRYDHGAQYLSPEPESRVATLVRDTLGEGLVEVPGAIWPFDADGTLRPDRSRPADGPRWTYRDGIAQIGHRLRDATPALDLRLGTRIDRLGRRAGRWVAVTDDGAALGDGFDAVLLTPPAPQSADLLRASGLGAVDALESVPYRSQFTVVWGGDGVVERPGAFYALVQQAARDEPGEHAVAWLAFESDKPGRAPEGATILLAQMGDRWTEAHYDADPHVVVAEATRAVEGLIGALPVPLWTDTQRWRYALPDARLPEATRALAEAEGVFLAGDATAGQGRVHLALEEGLDAADRVARHLGLSDDSDG